MPSTGMWKFKNVEDRKSIVLYLQPFQPHRQLSDALACGMEDRIADGGVGSDVAEFTESLDTCRVDLIVLFREQNHLDAWHVGIHRHEIIGEILFT